MEAFLDIEKLIEYLASSPNPYVAPSPRTNISFFFLLSLRTDKLLPTPKIIAFLPQ